MKIIFLFWILDHAFGGCLYESTKTMTIDGTTDGVLDLGIKQSQTQCTLACQVKEGRESLLSESNRCLCSHTFIEVHSGASTFTGMRMSLNENQVSILFLSI